MRAQRFCIHLKSLCVSVVFIVGLCCHACSAAMSCSSKVDATLRNTLQHTATLRNTLQHTTYYACSGWKEHEHATRDGQEQDRSCVDRCTWMCVYVVLVCVSVLEMGVVGTWWLWFVGSIKLQVSFAKEPYKRDDILQKRPII